MASDRKIYVVYYNKPQGEQFTKSAVLVRASNAVRAERHVAQDVLGIKAKYAEQQDLAEMLAAGEKIADAREDA